MKIPIQRIPQIDKDGFVAYVNAFALGNPPEWAPVTILKFLTWLQEPPCSNLSIDSEEFRHNPITSQIPRDVLHQVADVAEIDWSDALRMSVWDLVIQARGKVDGQEPAGDAILDRLEPLCEELPNQPDKILRELWTKKHAVTWKTIGGIAGAFRDESPSDTTIEKALVRLRALLSDYYPIGQCTLTIFKKKKRVRLNQPKMQKDK